MKLFTSNACDSFAGAGRVDGNIPRSIRQLMVSIHDRQRCQTNNTSSQWRRAGLRRGMIDQVDGGPPAKIDFMEVAPENWIVGGKLAKFRFFTERYPFLIHGLSLSTALTPLNETCFVISGHHGLARHSVLPEHLSYCVTMASFMT
jgi:hypothetical protein